MPAIENVSCAAPWNAKDARAIQRTDQLVRLVDDPLTEAGLRAGRDHIGAHDLVGVDQPAVGRDLESGAGAPTPGTATAGSWNESDVLTPTVTDERAENFVSSSVSGVMLR